MDENQASVEYWEAVGRLNDVIESGHRGSREEVLDELEDDLK